MERFNGEVRDREKVMRNLKIKTTPILTGLELVWNTDFRPRLWPRTSSMKQSKRVKYATVTSGRLCEGDGHHPQPQQQHEDLTDKLKKYADLKQQGIITEEEFQKLKLDLFPKM